MATGNTVSMPQSLRGSEVDDWLDHEIASLRQAVEGDAYLRAVPEPQAASAARGSSRPRLLLRLRDLLGGHQVDIVFLALAVTLPPAIVWIVFSVIQP